MQRILFPLYITSQKLSDMHMSGYVNMDARNSWSDLISAAHFIIGCNSTSAAAELHSKALSDTAQLKLSMYGKDPNNTAIIRTVVPNDTDTLSFDSDGGEGEFAVPARHEKGSLEDTWRIDPQHLQCRRKSNGELFKLGDGECFLARLNVFPRTEVCQAPASLF
jgi:hypothetical protein